MPTIRLAHSPDSDDAFMFYARAAGKIDTGDRRYVHALQEIESLNTRAANGELDVTAVSFHAYAYLHQHYALLSHGCSMGDGYGPRLVSKAAAPTNVAQGLGGKRIAIPGERTTANLALHLLRKDVNTILVPFDQIEDHVLAGRSDVGLLIHEGQLTYQGRGLNLWLDLGAWWKEKTRLPLPLGGNVVRKSLGDELVRAVSRDLRASIVYGLEHRAPALAHAKQYARGLADDKMDEFVGMYVNDFTVDYGVVGRAAVQKLLDEGRAAGLLPGVRAEFVDDAEG